MSEEKEKKEIIKLRLFAFFIVVVLLISGYFMVDNKKESDLNRLMLLKLYR